MKIIYNCWFALCMLLLITSCNDEWKDEQYRQYISFKAPIKDKDNGVTPIYVRYNPDGKVRYQLPVIVSGSTTNEQDIDVHVALYVSAGVQICGIRYWRKINMNSRK